MHDPEALDTDPSALLTPEAVRRLLARGDRVQVLDARGSAAHARSAERVAGDLRAHGRDLSPLLPRLDPDAWLLAYCTCLGDGLAVRVAARLQEAGFPRARGIAGGLEGCRAAGLPLVAKE